MDGNQFQADLPVLSQVIHCRADRNGKTFCYNSDSDICSVKKRCPSRALGSRCSNDNFCVRSVGPALDPPSPFCQCYKGKCQIQQQNGNHAKC